MPTRGKNSRMDDKTKVKTTLIQKDPHKGTTQINYCPKTSLSIMKKIPNYINKRRNVCLESHGLFHKEKSKWNLRNTLLIIYKSRRSKGDKNKEENAAMVWINNKKAYDMVQPTWIMKCLKVIGISASPKFHLELWETGEYH